MVFMDDGWKHGRPPFVGGLPGCVFRRPAYWMLMVRVFGLASSDFGMVSCSTPFT